MMSLWWLVPAFLVGFHAGAVLVAIMSMARDEPDLPCKQLGSTPLIKA